MNLPETLLALAGMATAGAVGWIRGKMAGYAAAVDELAQLMEGTAVDR